MASDIVERLRHRALTKDDEPGPLAEIDADLDRQAATEIERLKEWANHRLKLSPTGEQVMALADDLEAAEQRVAELEAKLSAARQELLLGADALRNAEKACERMLQAATDARFGEVQDG